MVAGEFGGSVGQRWTLVESMVVVEEADVWDFLFLFFFGCFSNRGFHEMDVRVGIVPIEELR